MRLSRYFLFAVIISASAATATELASHTIIIPIAGRTPGAFGTDWRTDLFVTNASKTAIADVSIVFSRAGQPDLMTTTTLQPRATMVYRDVIRQTFGLDVATGMLRVGANAPESTITARARIYNAGSGAGEYSQTVQGVPLSKLSTVAVIPGLSGVGGNRTNIGIANPSATTAAAFITLYDSTGESHGGFAVNVAPRSVLTINDIFSWFGQPYDGATVQVSSQNPIYAYGSVIRSDTGDSDFVSGVGVTASAGDDIIAPACSNPAPLHLAPVPSHGWIVIFDDGVDPFAATAVLEAKYGFKAGTVYAFGGFFSDLTPATVAALRCEADVHVIEQNGQAPLP